MEPVLDDGLPNLRLSLGLPVGPRLGVRRPEGTRSKQSDGLVENSGSRRGPNRIAVLIEKFDVFLGQADAYFHTFILLVFLPR